MLDLALLAVELRTDPLSRGYVVMTRAEASADLNYQEQTMIEDESSEPVEPRAVVNYLAKAKGNGSQPVVSTMIGRIYQVIADGYLLEN